MISLIFAVIGIVCAYYLGVLFTEKKYEKVLIENRELQERTLAWAEHCKALRERYFALMMKNKPPHENEPCIFQEKEKYRNVTVVISECKKCGVQDISWYRQEDTEEVEVE